MEREIQKGAYVKGDTKNLKKNLQSVKEKVESKEVKNEPKDMTGKVDKS